MEGGHFTGLWFGALRLWCEGVMERERELDEWMAPEATKWNLNMVCEDHWFGKKKEKGEIYLPDSQYRLTSSQMLLQSVSLIPGNLIVHFASMQFSIFEM